MPNLSEADRQAVHAEFMAQISAANESFAAPLTKPNVRAAVDGLDQWVSDNAATANAAIPQPARTGLTQAQKARLQSLIVLKRYGTGTI